MKIQNCLVVIFNHRYDNNIEKIKKLYGERFSKVVMLMPFYDGDDPDVIPVYESSFQFCGYLIQAYEKLRDIDAEYYTFIGDDVCLNPELSEKTINQMFGLQSKKVFITSIFSLNQPNRFAWRHTRDSSVPFFQRETRWKASVPDYTAAMKLFEDFFGKKYDEEYADEFFEGRYNGEDDEKHSQAVEEFLKQNRNKRKIPYPMAWGYSDIFVIKKEQLFSIARLCGVFSAMNMFVEIALPTAIVLTTKREDVVFCQELDYKEQIYWGADNVEAFEEYNCRSLKYLYENWDSKILYIHPVKLSKWSLENEN